ncbi:MAG TPA: glycosyl hydrolase family 65 protein [Planctomycetota bacterium]|nr:glycosyl hydrolase family 65 protein [Planctomycetota bacterium]
MDSIPESCRTLPRALQQPLRILAFDWDGTAVADRREDATPTRELLEPLLDLDVLVVIVSGTNFGNIDRQLSSGIRGPRKRRLFVLANRGSEAYGFDLRGEPVLLQRRQASPDEERLLTEVAEAVRDELVRRSGLDIRIVADRLNRRKIDLIPLPEWSDPPKAKIGELHEHVEERLRKAGIAGVDEVRRLAARIAREKGLTDARLTSDIKHVEVGLTDKSDAIRWVLRELAQPRAIPVGEILIGGDEFGPLSGGEGSDARMMVPEAQGAVVVSVGPEPAGVPPGVIPLGGGPARFRELLACQADLHERRAWAELPARRTRDPRWLLVEEGWTPAREQEIESLFALANGYAGIRGALEEDGVYSNPATFLAGVFDSGPYPTSVPELAVAPNWIEVHLKSPDGPLNLATGTTLEHARTLDLRQGILWRDWLHRDASGRETRIRTLRFASLADRHVLVQSVAVTPMNYSGRLDLAALLEVPGDASATVKLVPESVTTRRQGERDVLRVCELRTSRSDVRVTFATASLIRPDLPGESTTAVLESWALNVQRGRTTRFDRLCAVYSSLETSRPTEEALRSLDHLLEEGTGAALQAHVAAWDARWHDAWIEVEGDARAERSLRFGVYHLVGTANPDDTRISIGARALTGDAYKGHVFWETEIYVLPFHALTQPPAARALLLYRYHTLDPARQRARALGYAGALYAWESAASGEDTTPDLVLTPTGDVVKIWTGRREHHISADVAYAVDLYVRASGDEEFLLRYGAEILFETARFWASRGIWGEDGRYHIEHVIGPDEYHEDVDDNAYTNLMAQWNLEHALQTATWMRERHPGAWTSLADHLHLDREEPSKWGEIARAMATGFHADTGLYEQFRGYFQLEDLDLSQFAGRRLPMDLLIGKRRIEQSQILKQPDVLMAVYLLWDRIPPKAREANFRYYEPRTGHGSSLSPPIHAAVAARLGETERALKYFEQTSAIDLSDAGSYAARGIHIGALGGLWQSAIMGFSGLSVGPEGLSLSPHLPAEWRRLAFAARWHGRRQEFNLEVPQPAGRKPVTVQEAVLSAPVSAAARTVPSEVAERRGLP